MNKVPAQEPLPIVPRWLDTTRLAHENPEAIAVDWRQYYDCHGLNWRGCLDWVSPAWEGSDEAYDEFRSLMWRAWDFFRGNYRRGDHTQPATGETPAAQSSPDFRRYYLGIYATLSAYSHLFDEASECYDRRFRYQDFSRRYREQAEAPLLRFMASTLAARCLCEAVESGGAIDSPSLAWEGQTYASPHIWPLKKAIDTQDSSLVELVICNDAKSRLADAVEGNRLKLASGERTHIFRYEVESGDFAPIIGALKSFYIGESLYPMWM